MMRFRCKVAWVALVALHLILGGCGGKKQTPDQKMRQYFRSSTGLDLPDDVECIGAKCFTVFPPGLDTYYIKMKVPSHFAKFLEDEFSQENWWSEIERDMTPPEDWQQELSYWNIEEIKGKKYYCTQAGDQGDGMPEFKATLSYDENEGVVYFVGMQIGGF